MKRTSQTAPLKSRCVEYKNRVMKSAVTGRMECEVLSRHPIQLTNCMLASRTADSWLNLENECISCQFDLKKQDKQNWIPSGKMEHSSVSETAVIEMLLRTPSGVYKTRNVRRRPELERWDFEFLTTLKGTPWNPNPAAGEMAADALPADKTVPVPASAPVPPVVVAAVQVDRAASR